MSAADRFLALFRPAQHAYGTYITAREAPEPGKKFEGAGTTIHAALTVGVLAEHLVGSKRVGAVPVHKDGHCYFGAIDIDKYNIDIIAWAKKIKKLKLPLIACASKSGGVHLYIFSRAGLTAEDMRERLVVMSGKLHLACEIFPKQPSLKEGDKGNWINLPYFNGSCFAVDPDGNKLTLEEFLTAGEALAAQVDSPARAKREKAQDLEFDLDAATELLTEHWASDRHLLALTVSGALLRCGVDQDAVVALIAAVTAAAGDEDPQERLNCVDIAARAIAEDRRMYGVPQLRERLGADADKFLEACGIEFGSDAHELDEFVSYLEHHEYIFLPTRALWPASSLNATLRKVKAGRGKIAASLWLDRNRPVHQMIWAPGEDELVRDKLVAEGGWLAAPGKVTYNLYRPPNAVAGDARAIGPWIRLLVKVWPRYARREILSYFAHRIQRPAEKINHALVLGGAPGIGKDTLLEPLKVGVGSWNFAEISPTHLLGRFNGYLKSVVLRVSEARDLGEVNRYALYEHMKTLTASPPDVLRCDEKNLKEHSVFNLSGVIVTTNHRTGGLYLPPDDRRHFVAWSDRKSEDFPEDSWKQLWKWYYSGGIENVVAFLKAYDLAGWDCKAPPVKTPAFWDIVDAERPAEESELRDCLDKLGRPAVITLELLLRTAQSGIASSEARSELAEWLADRKNRRQVPHRLSEAGYLPIRNPMVKDDGTWRVAGRRQVVYGRVDLSVREQLAAASVLVKSTENIEDRM